MLDSLYSRPLHGVECFTTENEKCSDLPFSLNVSESIIAAPSDIAPLWSQINTGKSHTTHLNIYRQSPLENLLEVKCEGSGRFLLGERKIDVDWDTGGTGSTHYFQTVALALWLELRGIPCIHANALEFQGKTIALLGPSGMGKSTLSAFLQQSGFKWLTDDMLALHNLPGDESTSENCYIYPSWPKARMWPDSVNEITNYDTNILKKVHLRFHKREIDIPHIKTNKPFRLDAIYVLNREGGVFNKNDMFVKLSQTANRNDIRNVNATLSVMTLLQNSMMGDAYRSLLLEVERLQKLSALVSMIPLKQISYTNGLAGLTQIKDMILKDIF